ncbi:MAG: polyprenyl synthetase family protein [Deltaproteobacteria bacterium]|nr:polyprenyl synthetase family protein [Deltaproteobacteria bacterium]
MDLRSYLLEKKKIVDDALEEYCPRPEGPASELVKAMRYSLFAGGKRLRPILCMAGASTVGGEEAESIVLPVACALEMIHTYSLIHDDLPAMDDDDWRRGRPTSHKIFGEAVAVLAGDALLTEAFRLMAHQGSCGRLDPHLLLRVISLVAVCAGHQGMVGGQAVDIESEGGEADASLVEFIHTHKTGTLILASVSTGAILGGGTKEEISAISSYGKKVGLAFQVADDILDVTGDRKTMGKDAGSDERKGKITYPSVLGLDKAEDIKRGLVKEAIEALDIFGQRADPLRYIAKYVAERNR